MCLLKKNQYKIVITRHDRTLRGDGVVLICRADMSVDLVSCSSDRLFQVGSDIPAEFCLFLVLSVFVDSILVLVNYIPTSCAHFGALMDSDSESIGRAPHVVVMDDFNYNLTDPLTHSARICSKICPNGPL